MTVTEPARGSPIAPGYRLDRYEMLCPIAEGGMASVWIARLLGKRGFEKLVAIKTILPKFAQDPRFERMFLDEAGLAARIEHANVAQVLDLGEEHDVLYLAMELVDGDSLSRLLNVVTKKGLKIPPGIVLRILADTSGGLHAAHEVRGRDGGLLNVVHRDVSPQNILVTGHGVAKLIDFGIAKARDRVSDDTSEGQLKGKIHYMAPEQAVGNPVDRRADIFAVGAIIYFLLAGKPPFAGENEMATLFNLTGAKPAPALPDDIHPAVSAVVMKAISHDPNDRYATAAEMQLAIEGAITASGLITPNAIVGAFVQEHMAERARRRKEGLDLALTAAAQRENVARILERVGGDTPSGHGVQMGDERISTLPASYPTIAQGKSSRPPATAQAWSAVTLAEGTSAPADRSLSDDVDSLRPRRKLGWLVGIVLALIAVPIVVAFLTRPKVTSSTSRQTAATTSAWPASSSPSGTVADGGPLGAASVPTMDWSAIPVIATSAPKPTSRPTSARPTATVPTVTPTSKHRVNDGF